MVLTRPVYDTYLNAGTQCIYTYLDKVHRMFYTYLYRYTQRWAMHIEGRLTFN